MIYNKMYYTVFNAVTDALEVVKKLLPSVEREQIVKILVQSQQAGEDLYLSQGDE